MYKMVLMEHFEKIKLSKMIKEKELLSLITRRNVSYYKSLGYNISKIDTEVLIKIEDINKNSHQVITAICEKCGKETKISLYKYYENKSRNNYYGCKECSREKFKQTCLEKYGVDNPLKVKKIKEKVEKNNIEKYGVKTTLLEEKTREKIKQTNIKLYGCEEVLSSDIIKEKSKQTLINKYGVDHYSKTKDFLEKYKETSLEKYGTDFPQQSEEIKEKTKINNIFKYGHTSPFHSIEYKKTINNNYKEKYKHINIIDINDNMLKIKCDKCGEIYEISKNIFGFRHKNDTIICTICNPIKSGRSGKEILLYDFILQNYDGEILINDRKILDGKELDIYLPELKLGIEFNGMFWHSEYYKGKQYHRDKMSKSVEKGINLFTIWETDWDNNSELIKKILLKKLNKLKNKSINSYEILEIDLKDAKNFMNTNHIHGYKNCTKRIGLFVDEELLSVFLIKNNKLIRYCDEMNININSIDLFKKEYDISFELEPYYMIKDEIVEITKPEVIFITSEKHKVYNCGNLIYNKKTTK